MRRLRRRDRRRRRGRMAQVGQRGPAAGAGMLAHHRQHQLSMRLRAWSSAFRRTALRRRQRCHSASRFFHRSAGARGRRRRSPLAPGIAGTAPPATPAFAGELAGEEVEQRETDLLDGLTAAGRPANSLLAIRCTAASLARTQGCAATPMPTSSARPRSGGSVCPRLRSRVAGPRRRGRGAAASASDSRSSGAGYWIKPSPATGAARRARRPAAQVIERYGRRAVEPCDASCGLS